MSKEKGRILKGVQSISGGTPYGYFTRFYAEV